MSELSSAARSIVDAGRAAQSPSAASKAQVQAALDQAIVEASATGSVAGSAVTAGTVAIGASGQSGLSKILISSFVIVTVGVGYFLLRQSDTPGSTSTSSAPAVHAMIALEEPVPTRAAPAASDLPAPAANDVPASAASDDPASATSEAPVVEAAPEPTRRRHRKRAEQQPTQESISADTDTLLAEQALIGVAQKAIRDGDYTRAQTLLAEHRRVFPRGVLSPERQATIAIALCLAGPLSRGQATATAFLEAHPRSPLAGQVRKSCQLD